MTRTQFTELVCGEQERLRRFLLALCCGNRAEADDIAQETLVKAYLSSGGYFEKGRFTSWLYKIAHNTFIDYKRGTKEILSVNDALQVADPLSSADRNLKYQYLYAAIDSLPRKERTSILLFYLNGYSVKEICKIVDCSDDAVKKQLSRGREHLKKILCND